MSAIIALLKYSKFLGPVISMLITIGAYALLFPLEFAIGLVAMLFIHEMGHIVAAKIKGLPVSAPVFIPFIGALIMLKKNPRDAVTEAFVAFGGPLLGTIGAIITLFLGLAWQSELLIVVANVGFFLNLINLLPIHPLDGGRISVAVTRWLWLVGLIGGLFVIIWIKSFLFFIIWALFAYELWQKYVKKKKSRTSSVLSKIEIPIEQFTFYQGMIPGVEHQRELSFSTYSMLDQTQKVVVHWDGIGLHKIVRLPEHIQAIIHKVKVIKVEAVPADMPEKLIMHVQIDYELHEANDYYDVPGLTRWRYGIAYVALIAVLVTMLTLANTQGSGLPG